MILVVILKKQFILDENVLISAQTGLNDREQPDPTCTNLVNNIIRICHTIVIDTSLFNRYRRQLNRSRNRPTIYGAAMMPVLMRAIQVPGKYDRFDRASAPPFEGEKTIPQGSQDDVPVSVRLAVQTGATLVTTDGPLREHLAMSHFEFLRELHVVTPQEALSLL